MTVFPTELVTCAEMGDADRRTIAGGMPGIDLMERAGAAVADVARRLLAQTGGRHVVVLCGPGNNGGDGFVAARLLRAMGFDVSAGLLGDIGKLRGDAALAARSWTGRTGSAALADLSGADLVIDALFGAGLVRDIDGRARAIVERINDWRSASGGKVVAVDVPSGVDGDTGEVRGVSVEADATVTFFRLKPGHVLLPGRRLCGAIELADIGIRTDVLAQIAPKAVINQPGLWLPLLPAPREDGHKYTRGHALVLSGPAHQTGAARLAARGALRAGAGLVTMAAEGEAVAINAAHLTAIMIAPFEGPSGLSAILDDARKNAIAIGPGSGVSAATAALVETALKHGNCPTVVLDADALTSFGGRSRVLSGLVAGRARPVVLTPHEGEFSRLFNVLDETSESDSELEVTGFQGAGQATSMMTGKSEAKGDHAASMASHSPVPRIDRARAAARASSAVICLKGADTIVAAPDGRVSVMAHASPWLATAGSGDVLTGMVTGLLAQAMPAFEATSAAVWMHARAAALFGPGLIAEDIPDTLPAVWRSLVR